MNKEFKKGILEICVLHYINQEDRYGYQIVQELQSVFNIKESTIYPILKRLNRDGKLDTYLKESSSGPARKYYKITTDGEEFLQVSLTNWNEFVETTNQYLS